jgi:kynureninase
LAESQLLDPPWPLDEEDPRPKSSKSRLNIDGTILEGKSIGLDPKKTKKRAQRRELMIWRTKM